MRDYLQRDHTHADHWRTRTLLFGVNGTEQIANVGVYVLGQGQVLFSVFRTIPPAQESFLLPGPFYFGQPFQNLADGDPPANVGETIVVVSNRPVIVTGAVLRGTVHELDFRETERLATSHTQSARTLDVRQFDCTVPEEFAKVAAFCRNLSPVENN